MNEFLKRYKYIIIIILALTIFWVSFINYRSTKEVIREKYNSRRLLVEKNILQTVNYINDSYEAVEQELNKKMKNYSQIMVEKYKENPNVNEWDLEKLKEKFSGYEIYIINSDLEIIKTTYKKDLGLDFSKFESFSKILRKRLNGNSFEVDRLDLATQTGEVKKYSYMPTPDNKYLLELSINVQKEFSSLQSLDMFGDASNLTQEYDIVKEIAFFTVEPINHEVGKLRSSKKPYIQPDVAEIEDELARKAVLNKEVQTKEVNNGENNYIYRFFPALVPNESEVSRGWNFYVVGITYDNDVMFQEFKKHRTLFSINILIMAIVFLIFIAIVVYLLNKFEYQAYHDQLTSLAGRKLFEEEFEKLKDKAREKSNKFAILFLDIDKFKNINDNYGHNVGDIVLKKIATRLQSNLKDKDCLARLGGDEFVIMIADIDSKKQASEIGYRILKIFDQPILIDDKKIEINISGGISIYPEDGRELEELIKNADYAMYQAKRGENNLEVRKEKEGDEN